MAEDEYKFYDGADDLTFEKSHEPLSEAEVLGRIAQKTAPRVTEEMIDAKVAGAKSIEYLRSDTMTICVITLVSGFKLTGESACVDPANYDEQIGKSIAFRNAKDRLWALEGYLLAEKLASE